MFRAVLAMCLITTTLLGPVMCCCAATPIHFQESSTTLSAPAKRSCCAKSEQTPPSEHQKTPKHDECPCNKNKPTQAVRVDSVSTLTLDQLLTTFSEAIAVDHSLTPLVLVTATPRAVHPCGLLMSEQILDAHHRLRC